MITFLIFIFILSILIVAHELGHFIAAKRLGIRVEEFFLGIGGKKILSGKKNGTEYGVRTLLIGGYVKLAGDNLEEYRGNADEYLSKPPGKRFWVIFLGPLFNYVLGLLCFWSIFFLGYPTLTTKVGGLIENFGAKEAGIQAGDEIIAVDGKGVSFFEDLQNIIQKKKDTGKVRLSVLRDNREYNIVVNIKEKELVDLLGRKHTVGLLGIMPSDEFVKIRHGFIQSFSLSLGKVWDLTAKTYQGLWLLITGTLSLRESTTGLLGMYFITSKVAPLGIIPILHLMAIINVSLCIFNLLPLPIIDGGHILLLAIEKIRGKGLNLKAERFIARTGWALIMTLLIVITYNDLLRYYGDKIDKVFKWFSR